MNLKIELVAENAISVQIDREDYSIADIIHKELLNVKHVKFAGVPPPHPLLKTLTIQVHTDGVKPAKALLDAVESSQEKVSDLLKVSRQMFPSAPLKSQVNTSDNLPQSTKGEIAQST